METTKKLAVITGASKGIGLSILKTLSQSGYIACGLYNKPDKNIKILEKKYNIKFYHSDVSSYDKMQITIDSIIKKFGNIEILINNAGITMDKTFHNMSSDEWHKVINVNLNSCFNVTRHVIKSMRDHYFGRIINISSINGAKGQIGQTNYCASKSGIIGFTKALAMENAKYGITVNAIAPGYIDTDMLSKMPTDILNKIIDNIPLKRLGKSEEIAKTCLFLIESPFITGSTIDINGGMYMR